MTSVREKPAFAFRDYPVLSDGEIELVLREKYPGGERKGHFVTLPAYVFDIRLAGTPEPIGDIDLRIGTTRHIRYWGGHIGYGIGEPWRGHRYAAKACNLVKRVALDHGRRVLWLTCNPENAASRRTCEHVGAELVDIIPISSHTERYRRGERRTCRYRWDLRKPVKNGGTP